MGYETIKIQTKRVYQPVEKKDGVRILIDRIWPRGMTKERLRADIWMKEAAPSTALRKWFNHDHSKWEAFKNHYFLELDGNPAAVKQLLEIISKKEKITLLFSARDIQCNHAVALKEYLAKLAKNKAAAKRSVLKEEE